MLSCFLPLIGARLRQHGLGLELEGARPGALAAVCAHTMFGGLGGAGSTWGAPGSEASNGLQWNDEKSGAGGQTGLGGLPIGGADKKEEPEFAGAAADDMMMAIATEGALGALGADDDDETFGGEFLSFAGALPARAIRREPCAFLGVAGLTARARADSAASWGGGAGTSSMVAQFEQEKAQLRMGMGGLLTPGDLSGAPAPAAPPVVTAAGGSNLGIWLTALGAGEFEGAFRDQQFETVEELVEARCAFKLAHTHSFCTSCPLEPIGC